MLRRHAKKMRSEPTPAEHRLWQILRAKRLAGYKFKRQLPIDQYVVDFACLSHRLIVEAVRHQSYDLALQAFAVNPFVASVDKARRMLDAVVKNEALELR